MNKHQITELALKLLAIACFIYAISHAGYSLSFLFIPEAQFSSSNIVVAFASPIIGPIFSGLLLFLFAKKLSTKLIDSSNTENNVVINIEAKELHSILLSIFGFALIIYTILPLFNYISGYINNDTVPNLGFLFGFGLQLILGMWLAFGSNSISRFIYKLRYSAR